MQLQICFCATFSNVVKNLRLRNCPPEKILNPRKKFWTHEIPTRKNLEHAKYARQIILGPRNTNEKKFGTYKTPTRKNLGPMKYRRANILDPRNTHEGTIAR